MLQLIRQITKDSKDDTKLSLLFANQTEKDILLRDELERLAKQHADQFRVWYTVDVATEGRKFHSIFINSNELGFILLILITCD